MDYISYFSDLNSGADQIFLQLAVTAKVKYWAQQYLVLH